MNPLFRSTTTPRFWACFNALPAEIQEQAAKQHELFLEHPYHPSLRLKQIDFVSIEEPVEVDAGTLAAIDRGIRDADEGRTVSIDEVRKLIPQRISKFESRKPR